MRKNFGAQTILFPMPVFIIGTYDDNGKENLMNAAWGGIADYHQIMICLSEEHKTTQNLLKRNAFTVSMADASHVAQCDYVGVVSGNDEPCKMEKSGFHFEKASCVDAPIVMELPMALECKVISYDTETGMLIGDIVNIAAEESILDEKGKIDASKLRPITFDASQNVYREIGDVVGKAFYDGVQWKKSH